MKAGRTPTEGATSLGGMTTPFEVLFSLTVYRDGNVTLGGTPRGPVRVALPEVLRTIALAVEDGALVFDEEGEPWD